MNDRETKKHLSKIMLDTNMGCMGIGIYTMQEIYEKVKNNHKELCNDQYRCIDSCKSGGQSPEWQHVIRGNMQAMKKRGRAISVGNGSWKFVEIEG